MRNNMQYNWERGTLTLPARAWKRFREALSQADEIRRTHLYAIASDLYALLVKSYPGIENDYAQVLVVLSKPDTPCKALLERLGEFNGYNEVLAALRDKNDGRRMRRPAPEDFAAAKPQTLATLSVGECLGRVILDHGRRQVSWSVYWGDRAREAARNSYYGRVFFTLLETLQWTPGTGGVLVGNDEHNQSVDGIGKGRDYVTAAFGPVGLGS
jgi:hypothetical protein